VTDPLSAALAAQSQGPNLTTVRTGVVTGVNPLVLDVQGASIVNAGWLDSYEPVVNDVVAVLVQDQTWLVLGLPNAADSLKVVPVGGLVVSAVETTDGGAIAGAHVDIGGVSALLILGQTYEVTCGAQLVSNAADIYGASLWAGPVATGTELHTGRMASSTSDQARPNVIPLRCLFVPTVTGVQSFRVSGIRVAGAGTVRREAGTTHPQLITVIRVR
jgi:hypothetical protein